MNLEDFKSFCRVLIPSEVGSIPTHSRQSLPWARAATTVCALGIAILGVTLAGNAGAEDPGGPGEPGGREGALPFPSVEAPVAGLPPRPVPPGEKLATAPGPLERAFRSALFPAWGQLTNGRSKKAVVLFSVQTYVYTRIVLETRRAWEAQRRADRLEALGSDDPMVLSEQAAAEASSQDHFGRRRDLLFWALVGGFYGAMDAYIDAQLGDFQGDLEKDRALFGGIDPAQGTLELGLRF